MPRPIAVTLRRQFAWLVAVLLAVGAARLFAGQYLDEVYAGQLHRSDTATRSNQRMLQDLTDAETGVRGYQLTGDPRFLDPFRAGAEDYPVAKTAALRAAPDDHTRTLVRAEDQTAQRWLAQFALPITALPPGRPERPGSDAADSARGKELFDDIRTANAAVTAAVDQRHLAETAAHRTANRFLETTLAVLAMLPVLILLRLHRSIRRQLLDPLAHVRQVFDRLGAGDYDVRAVVAGPPEVQGIAEALNARLDVAVQARERVTAAHEELSAQKAYLDQVLDVIEVAVLTCDADGRIVHLNRVARGNRTDGSDPRTIADLDAVRTPGGPAPDPRRHPLARALAGETVAGLEMVFRPPGGATERSILVDARPLCDATGHTIGAVTTGYDVTALREREADLAAFAGIAAHDLKAPLTTIAGYAEILAEDRTTAADLAVVTRIGAGVERMRRLIDDLLAYATARDAPLHTNPVDLAALVTEIAADRGAAPLVHIDGRLPVLAADPGMIRQLFENLIGNALKYTPPDRPAAVTVSAEFRADGGAHVSVADRGIGIPADQQARVFTSFHRAHTDRGYAGTGLGLAICQRVVSRHGGTITAGDNPGGGTRIHITLPAAAVGAGWLPQRVENSVS